MNPVASEPTIKKAPYQTPDHLISQLPDYPISQLPDTPITQYPFSLYLMAFYSQIQ